MSESPSEQASDDTFDFVRECIETYREAQAEGDLDARIKVLTLLNKVALPDTPVKVDAPSDNNRSAVQAAQDKLRKR